MRTSLGGRLYSRNPRRASVRYDPDIVSDAEPVHSPTFLGRIRSVITEALRFWEPLRLAYNITLAVVVLGYFVTAWPSSRTTVALNGVLVLFVLGVLANVCYCAAYLGDVFVQLSGFRSAWRSLRWVLVVIGTTFAAVITRFFALGFFNFPV